MAFGKKEPKKSPNGGFAKDKEGKVFWQTATTKPDFPWWEVDHAVLLASIIAVGKEGGQLTFGSAAGGLSISVAVWHGGERKVEYAGNATQLEALLTDLIEVFQGSEDLMLSIRANLQ